MWIHRSFFPKTCTKGHWPLDDLWPHVCWGHMCDSTQGSLCPSPMTIHQCMWIQWWILQITTYIHILHTYYIHTCTYYVQNEWSHSLLLNSVQARQKYQNLKTVKVWMNWTLRNWQQRVIIPRWFLMILVDGKWREDRELAENITEVFERQGIIAQFENLFQKLIIIRGYIPSCSQFQER